MTKTELPTLTFTFLFVVRSPCINIQTLAKAVKDVDLSDGDLLHYWSTSGRYLEAAVDRAIKRCNDLRERTGLEWRFDDEFDIKTGDTSERHSFHDAEPLGKKLERADLW